MGARRKSCELPTWGTSALTWGGRAGFTYLHASSARSCPANAHRSLARRKRCLEGEKAMLGAIVGTVCVLGLFRVARRAMGYRRGYGWGGACHSGFGGDGDYGARHRRG